jgi:hypothetical protein
MISASVRRWLLVLCVATSRDWLIAYADGCCTGFTFEVIGEATMKAHVLRGSKQEIAAGLDRLSGEVREAIVFEEEPVPTIPTAQEADLFAEMRPFMVDVQDLDDSRDAIYVRMEGE